MKRQINNRLPPSIIIVLSAIAILLFTGSCSKDKKRTDTGKLPTDSSKIVYTNLKPDSVILKLEADSFNLDLNNDGIPDFEFDRSHIVLCDDNMLGTWAYAINLTLKPASGNNASMELGSNFILDSLSVISPRSTWRTTPLLLLYGATSATGHCIASLPVVSGYCLNVSDKYIGLKFIKDNKTYYGWARMSSSYTLAPASHQLIIGGQFILKDYAYNGIPNQPILAGQTR